MAPVGTLYGASFQRQTIVIKTAAAIAGLELNLAEIKLGETNKSPAYLAKFPQGKIPAFEDAEGFILTEGLAIVNYIVSLAPESGLQGQTKKEAAEVEQWTHFAEFELQVSSDFTWYLATGYFPGYNKDFHTILLDRQYSALDHLERHLTRHEYLVGGRLTLADIVLAGSIKDAVGITLGTAERARYPKTFAHFNKVISHPKIKQVFGEIEFVETPLQHKGSA
ncbi:glutathione S-transferase C-terminal-like protein [Coniophora puteana RWD-64-598 SS2]|uniref:Glutathione S-transferase C-terminal-like protein n=1 Tax=Coniophora puteana (strain RWD-64-598) TaxID=741705 RepID=A0A5M3MNC7_CONPW|nr:glutathione S-transferase C-terminal-like protein [Coniophora puteana RWD-64-598 SS2]EIW80557.1 glutathione S-transferase C-terminal-like protein [Coniophora puteana RWD-64-598 SS2]